MQSFSRFISAKSRQGLSANKLIAGYRAAGGHIREQTALGSIRTVHKVEKRPEKVAAGVRGGNRPWKVIKKTKGWHSFKHYYQVTYPSVTGDTDYVTVADDEVHTRKEILEAAWLMINYSSDKSMYARRDGEEGTHDEFMADVRVIISEIQGLKR
jgi:hypothetical protein